MTGQEVVDAREDLGIAWGLGRGLYASELGRLLRLRNRDPGAQVRAWETGAAPVPGPVSVAIEMMLRGGRPEMLQTMEKPV